MNRRNNQRIPRGIQILFQPRGESQATAASPPTCRPRGCTSRPGIPGPKGTRVRVELLEEPNGFTVEAVVAHAHTVHPELAEGPAAGDGDPFS